MSNDEEIGKWIVELEKLPWKSGNMPDDEANEIINSEWQYVMERSVHGYRFVKTDLKKEIIDVIVQKEKSDE